MEARGGFDGVVISFGDGADGDTLDSCLGPMIEKGWTMKVTLKDGNEFTCEPVRFDVNDGDLVLVYHPWDELVDEVIEGTTDSVLYEDVVGMSVY